MNEPSNLETNVDPPIYPSDHPVIKSLQCPTQGEDAKYEIPNYLTATAYIRNVIYIQGVSNFFVLRITFYFLAKCQKLFFFDIIGNFLILNL